MSDNFVSILWHQTNELTQQAFSCGMSIICHTMFLMLVLRKYLNERLWECLSVDHQESLLISDTNIMDYFHEFSSHSPWVIFLSNQSGSFIADIDNQCKRDDNYNQWYGYVPTGNWTMKWKLFLVLTPLLDTGDSWTQTFHVPLLLSSGMTLRSPNSFTFGLLEKAAGRD